MNRLLLLAVFCCGAVTQPASAQSQRDRALQLLKDGKQAEAIPLLDSLSASNPYDRVVLADYGFALFGASAKYADPAQRKQVRAKARAALAKARDLGDTSPVLLGLLRVIPEDGGPDIVFSRNPAVDSAMHRGEAAYSAGDLPAAQAAYREALALDPQQYAAAVFIGDTYFRMNKVDSALIWYHNAIAIDPHRELAHRYMSGCCSRIIDWMKPVTRRSRRSSRNRSTACRVEHSWTGPGRREPRSDFRGSTFRRVIP